MKSSVYSVGHDIFVIDLMDEEPLRTGCWVVKGNQGVALVETGSTLANDYIMNGLAELGIKPEDVQYVIATHIHLDHSGGVGSLIPRLPNAKVVCHPRAERHLVDPSRLVAGAKGVYGDQLETLFGEIKPVPAERLLIAAEDGFAIDVDGRVLTCWDTAGHARHHICIYDQKSKGLFSGDMVGCRHLAPGKPDSQGYVIASTSPSEFDMAETRKSLDKLQKLDIERIYHTHFGMSEPASETFKQTLDTAEEMVRIAEAMENLDDWQEMAAKVKEFVGRDLVKLGYTADQALVGLELDIRLNCQGILYSLKKEREKR